MERISKSELFTKNSNMQVEENQENGSTQETQIAKPNENPAKKTVNHALESHLNSYSTTNFSYLMIINFQNHISVLWIKDNLT